MITAEPPVHHIGLPLNLGQWTSRLEEKLEPIITATTATCSVLFSHVCQATAPTRKALMETINLIARFNLKLLGITVACALLHDYNIVLLYGLVGIIFSKNVNDFNQKVRDIFKVFFEIIQTPIKPLRNYTLYNIRILDKPITVALYIGAIFSFAFIKPISLILTECWCVVNCGANIATISQKILKERREEIEAEKLS